MLEVGRVCVKTAGRDATKLCVVVEEIDETFVLVDGNTRRKKVNKSHLEPLAQVLSLSKGADTKAVLAAFEGAGLPVKKKEEEKAKKEPKAQQKKEKPSKKPSKK
ncbi:50S ribosomal protein L14e [Candidatus Woesearchaeota archaeon]|nr:50S ribosomal protein L14e [Nanoarchaeota archaeon]MCB9370526.1 50S ribosomal protein L14e [Candidatus Woesearchaeota archaeon]USN43602.1 MAG: 50S ribosomal protein L14e [Candidatus Woesearchaeota archaeon]